MRNKDNITILDITPAVLFIQVYHIYTGPFDEQERDN